MSVNTNSNSYVMVFAVGICVVMSSVLALLATVLRPTQAAAKEFDRQKNVMKAAGLIDAKDTREREVLEKLFAERITEKVVDTKTGEIVADKTAQDLKDLNAEAAKVDPRSGKRYRMVATSKNDAGERSAYILPISGKGLWSTLYGYLALEGDKNTVKGITFYQHGETPGLGGEVENPSWTAQWDGKKIRNEAGELVSITVKKGVVDPSIEREKMHAVDGLAGATITSKGVENFVEADLKAFASYLEKH